MGSDVLHWTDSPSTVLPIYRRLIKNGLGILLYRYANMVKHQITLSAGDASCKTSTSPRCTASFPGPAKLDGTPSLEIPLLVRAHVVLTRDIDRSAFQEGFHV